MHSQQRSRKEYTARINRVMDYLEKHLQESVCLNVLAEIAHLSPFHFHRIFTLMVGETPADFTLRLRLEKAATNLAKAIHTSFITLAHPLIRTKNLYWIFVFLFVNFEKFKNRIRLLIPF